MRRLADTIVPAKKYLVSANESSAMASGVNGGIWRGHRSERRNGGSGGGINEAAAIIMAAASCGLSGMAYQCRQYQWHLG
jgi:hypothetical protein